MNVALIVLLVLLVFIATVYVIKINDDLRILSEKHNILDCQMRMIRSHLNMTDMDEE